MVGEMREGEHPWDGQGQVGTGNGGNHEVTQGLAADDAVGTVVMRVIIRDEMTVAVALPGGTGRHADAKGKCLLQDEHQHGRQDTGTIASGRVEYRHFLHGQGLCRDGILMLGVLPRLLDVQTRTDAHSLHHGGLIDTLVGEHERHVAIDTHGALLAPVDALGEIGRDEIDALHELSADERLRLVKILGMEKHSDIRRGIAVADELPGEHRVRLVDHHHRHLPQ